MLSHCFSGLGFVVGLKNSWMMRGGKEEDKILRPLFPRLHVGDADKGSPRAPPRNKMALYEQLSIPSQRFNPAAASSSSLPLRSYNAGTLIPSASSSQFGSHDWSVFSPFPRPQTPAQSAEMVQSRPFDGNNLKSTRTETGRSVGHANHKSSNAAGSVAECSSFHQRDYSTVKNFREEEDFRVPTFAYSEIAHSNKDTCVMETERLTPFCSNSLQRSCSATLISSIRFPSSYGKPLEQGSIDKKLGKLEKNHTEQNSKETAVIKETKENCVSHLETGDKFAEPSNYSKACSEQEHTSTENVIESTRQRSTAVCQEYCGNGAIDGLGCLNDINDVENEDALRLRIESCSKASFGNSQSKNMAGDCNHSSDDKVSVPVELRDADGNDEVSETSMVDSISGLEISPDDVVGIIGPKQFWKAKRAIVNQQRVFAVQVFELHRLIKVQKLIAASPHLLVEEKLYLSGSPQKAPNNILPPESNAKPQPQIAKQQDNFHKLNQNTECRTENTQLPPLSSHDDGLNKGLHQVPMYGPYSRVPPLPVPVSSEHKPTAWCYTPANHWLVPVMSPSEGLVYKPYSGLCPPAAGFMPPVYGGYGPLSLPPVTGDFMKAAYGVPAVHQRQNMAILSGASAIAPNYFPTPYGLPVVNPNISALSVEQVRPMGPRPNAQIEQCSQSSCNMAIARSEAFSGFPWKVSTSKDNELQGSTASSPERRVQEEGGALLLFPRASVTEGLARPSQSPGRNGQTRVIRVVPHNARSATESAARIFRSIQEERQQYEF